MAFFPQTQMALQMLLSLLLLLSVAQALPIIDSVLSRSSSSTTPFTSSCKNINYYAAGMIEAICTKKGEPITDSSAATQHSMLDLGRCVHYIPGTESLEWRNQTVPHLYTGYLLPCSQCTINNVTTVMTCSCQYVKPSRNHLTKILLSDHVVNTDGQLSCMGVKGNTV